MNTINLNEELKNASRNLANIIMQSTAYQEYELARLAVIGNKAASSIMKSLKKEQERLFEISCERDFEDDDFIKLEAIRKQADDNPIICSYFESEQNIFKLTRAINDELSALVGFDFALSVLQDESDNDEIWE